MKAPAFQFYADDFIGGTVAMTTEEVGAYMRLLCFQWGNGAIPDRKEQIDRIAGCTVSADVMAKFPEGKNPRMESEREKYAAYRQQQSNKGKASAQARFNRGSTVVQPEHQPKGNSPTPTPTPTPFSTPPSTPSNQETHTPPRKRGTRTASPPLECAAFAEFWSQYPRREGKANAEKAWLLHRCASILPKILAVIRQLKTSPQWTKDAGQFIPMPATWLNRRGWEDEAFIPTTSIQDDSLKQKYGW